jgi:hypothetical protein
MYTHINNPVCVYIQGGPTHPPNLEQRRLHHGIRVPSRKKKCGSAGFHQPKGMAIY